MKFLITGYHHSGTTFLTEIIRRLGVNIGSAENDRHLEHPILSQIDNDLVGPDWAFSDRAQYVDMINIPSDIILPDAYKNPRLMLTAKLWQDVFPGVKWIVISRYSYDVAQSIMDDKTRSQDIEHWQKSIYYYEEQFSKFKSRWLPDVLEIKYRALCCNPREEVAKIARFVQASIQKREATIKWVEENAKFKTYE